MARSEREIFNDHVTVLARQLGLELEDLSEIQRGRLLQQARLHRVNDHQAALLLAYDYLPQLLADNVERARVLVDRLALMTREWHEDDLVDDRLTAALERDARAQLRRAQR